MPLGHLILTAHLLLPAAGAPPGPPPGPPATTLLAAVHDAARATVVLPAPQKPSRGNWVKRHPVWTGAIIGFTAGYLIGYLPGDDAVFYDFTATFNGLVIGGLGAGVGALAGWVIGR